MGWDVLFDDDFAVWLDGLDGALRNEILAHTALLRERGPKWAGRTLILWRGQRSRI